MLYERMYTTKEKAVKAVRAIKFYEEMGIVRFISGPDLADEATLARHSLIKPKYGFVVKFETLDEMPVEPGHKDYTPTANAYCKLMECLGLDDPLGIVARDRRD